MNVGAPAGNTLKVEVTSNLSELFAGGMNAAVRSFVRMALYHHCKVYGIEDSFEGLARGSFKVRFFLLLEDSNF